jgi:hypothetical protein
MANDAKRLGPLTSFHLGVFKHRRRDGIWIEYFDEKAFERVCGALDAIKGAAPLWNRRVQRDIDRIVVTVLTSGAAAQYVSDINACEIDERFMLSDQCTRELAASVIIHESTHARLHHLGFTYSDDKRHRMEDICQRRELAFAAALADGAVIRESVEHRKSHPWDLSHNGFARRRKSGEKEALRYMGAPEWLIRSVLVLRSVINGVRRVFRTPMP